MENMLMLLVGFHFALQKSLNQTFDGFRLTIVGKRGYLYCSVTKCLKSATLPFILFTSK